MSKPRILRWATDFLTDAPPGGQTLWLYAYIFPRNPSLTFLTLRPQSDASPSVEGYLSGVRLK